MVVGALVGTVVGAAVAVVSTFVRGAVVIAVAVVVELWWESLSLTKTNHRCIPGESKPNKQSTTEAM